MKLAFHFESPYFFNPDFSEKEPQLYELYRNSASGMLNLQKYPLADSQTRLWYRIS